jgi:ABC-type histidine transport system ATPase subunit
MEERRIGRHGILERITYFPLILQGPHKKQRVKQFFYCCLCIRCRGNMFDEPLSSHDREIHI